MSCEQIACPRQAPPRRLFSRLGRLWGRVPARLSPIFAVSHRLSPLKVSAFFKRTLRPPAPPGGVFLHKTAHICSQLFVQTGELPHKLPAPPQFVAFFCNKPPHFALWVKGLFYIHPPHHTIVNHRTGISRCVHASGVHGEPGRDPFGSLCSRPAALCGLPPRIIFPSAHKPRPHLESCISGPGTCAGCNYFCRFPSKSRQTAAFFV